ncbi:MAG TPA: ABC transporter permease [Candidatus Eisenbacteria bacterium]|nr:ABC transporter permease [Candidatus Eisenbacteria bacterium]
MSSAALELTPAAEASAPPSAAREAVRRFARDRWALAGLVFLAALAAAALVAPWLVRHVLHQSAFQLRMMDRVRAGGRLVDVISDDGLPVGPGRAFLLGADLLGRDVLARILYGARVSLLVSSLGTLLALVAGLAAGLLAGFYRGVVDTVISRVVDAMMAIPVLLLAIALASVLRQGSLLVVVMILGLVNWTYLARIVRAEVLSLREREFVEAARALGASDRAVLLRHVVPNLIGPVIVFATLSLAGNILLESALSFLGVGIQPPTPSWGNMIQEGLPYYGAAWWITVFPGIAILLTVASFNLVGDGLRDALSPEAGA